MTEPKGNAEGTAPLGEKMATNEMIVENTSGKTVGWLRKCIIERGAELEKAEERIAKLEAVVALCGQLPPLGAFGHIYEAAGKVYPLPTIPLPDYLSPVKGTAPLHAEGRADLHPQLVIKELREYVADLDAERHKQRRELEPQRELARIADLVWRDAVICHQGEENFYRISPRFMELLADALNGLPKSAPPLPQAAWEEAARAGAEAALMDVARLLTLDKHPIFQPDELNQTPAQNAQAVQARLHGMSNTIFMERKETAAKLVATLKPVKPQNGGEK